MALIVEVNEALRNEAKELALAILEKQKKIGMTDKFEQGSPYFADFVGFLGEISFAKAYNLPKPVFTAQYTDECDFVLNGKKCDLKTTMQAKQKSRYFLNKQQYERKLGKIDVFIFSEYYPPYWRSIGWIEYENVPRVSTIVHFPNGTCAYRMKLGELKKMVELIPNET
jgi:hypothetical protein